MAPAATYRDMFNQTGVHSNKSFYGVEAIGVPGELAGSWYIFNKYGSGNISWKQLFTDAINYAQNGFEVGPHLSFALNYNRAFIDNISQLREVYINPATNELYKTGDIIKLPTLAKTLETLANSANPHKTFYKTIAQQILDDIYNKITHEFPGQKPIINLGDFQNYKVIESEAYIQQLPGNFVLHTTKLPSISL